MDFMSILSDIQKTVGIVNKCRENLSKVLPHIEQYHEIIFAVLQPITALLPPQYVTAINLVHKYGDMVISYLKAVQITEETDGIKGEEKLVNAVSIVTDIKPEEIKPIVAVAKEENTVDTIVSKVQEGTEVTQKILSSIKGVQSIVDSINNLL